MDTSYHEIITMFVDKYGLSRGQVIAEIEKTFSSMLSRWHGKHVVAVFAEDKLHALGYHQGPEGRIQVPVELTSLRGWNTIKRILDKNLSQAACLDEVARLKHRESRIQWGTIVSRETEHLGVELEMEPGMLILGRCPVRFIGPHERETLQVGEQRAFHVRRVDPILIKGTHRTDVVLDRISRTLVDQLLQNIHGGRKIRIRCTKRYVGHKSFVESNTFLPKKVILAVSLELGEHIQVKVTK